MSEHFQNHKACTLRAVLAACFAFWAAVGAIVAVYWSATAVIVCVTVCALLAVIAYIEACDAELELARHEAEEAAKNFTPQKQ